jgi:hypothetical protein
LFWSPSNVKWVPYNKFHVGNYDEALYDSIRSVIVLRVVSELDTFTRTSMNRWQHDQLILHKSRHREQANFAGVKHSTLKGLNPRINPDKPPRNLKDAMKALDKQAWAEADGVFGIRRTWCIQNSETRAGRENPRHNHTANTRRTMATFSKSRRVCV